MGQFIEVSAEKEVTLSNLINIVKERKHIFKNPWFRGQPNYDYKLIPGLFRKPDGEIGCLYDERTMIDEFKRRYHEWGHVQRTEFEWLSLMQHYSYPTRLLDWTTNIMVAIYFACRDCDCNQASLYVFNYELNFLAIWNLESQLKT